MTLVKPSERWAVTAAEAAQRSGYASQSELALRDGLESFCRQRWPDARIVHEIVMSEGKVRADVAAIAPSHIAAFEVKGAYDDTTRLLHQVGMFQLCVPEVWIVAAERHDADAKLIRHLLPSVGIMIGTGLGRDRDAGQARRDEPLSLRVEAEAVPRDPIPELMLRMLWADEVKQACAALRVPWGKKSTRENCVKALLAVASPAELITQVCISLRGRDALWRADPPVTNQSQPVSSVCEPTSHSNLFPPQD